ncbi:MAG: DUF6153 family protein [Cumulibacter sp.]
MRATLLLLGLLVGILAMHGAAAAPATAPSDVTIATHYDVSPDARDTPTSVNDHAPQADQDHTDHLAHLCVAMLMTALLLAMAHANAVRAASSEAARRRLHSARGALIRRIRPPPYGAHLLTHLSVSRT